jgi:hypothetical protein
MSVAKVMVEAVEGGFNISEVGGGQAFVGVADADVLLGDAVDLNVAIALQLPCPNCFQTNFVRYEIPAGWIAPHFGDETLPAAQRGEWSCHQPSASADFIAINFHRFGGTLDDTSRRLNQVAPTPNNLRLDLATQAGKTHTLKDSAVQVACHSDLIARYERCNIRNVFQKPVPEGGTLKKADCYRCLPII